jgi:hypothetical protein
VTAERADRDRRVKPAGAPGLEAEGPVVVRVAKEAAPAERAEPAVVAVAAEAVLVA